ncbi:hypothetical protein MA16_Dca011023 [Dendrobium catenatum]|uniref:Uncharacterized protein n=1 Tax=Dendrobium catenatum TaxID=906689 RepID=A0A2I0WCF1_9ASPA|nr:hypothetical protein MA16_Dca011023 [Dendrobium catenatum]
MKRWPKKAFWMKRLLIAELKKWSPSLKKKCEREEDGTEAEIHRDIKDPAAALCSSEWAG